MLKAAKEAGKAIMNYYGKAGKLTYKDSPKSLLTKADLLSDKIIISTIRKRFPEHNILTEESGFINKNSNYTWIIDPIDGTTNFVSKLPYFAVSIGLAKNNEVIMGVVYNPCTNEMYFAEKGKGSHLNNKRLHVSKKNELKECITSFSLPNNIIISRRTLGLLSKNFGAFRGIRNFGSAALNLCYIANAKIDLYFTLQIKAWDVAAAKLIVEEANGKVTNVNNKKWNVSDISIVATNGILHNKFVRLLKNK